MKAQLFACVLLVAIFAQSSSSTTDDDGFDIPNTHSLIRSKKNSKSSSQCRQKVQNSCTSTTKTCGRLGRANICQAFKNDCQRLLANCATTKASSKFYRKVNINLCKGMEVDKTLPCGSGGNSKSNGTTKIINF